MKNKKALKRIIVISISVILIIAIGYTSVYNVGTNTGENIVGTITSPVQKIFYNIGRIFSNSYESILEIYKVREENEQLKNRVYELTNENRILQDIVENQEYLKNEYKMRQMIEHDYEKAQIISRDPNNWFYKFTIDKGTKNGVKIDDIIVHAAEIEEDLVVIGLVGKVIDVGSNWAKVITIVDINSSLSFRNIKNNSSGILNGQIDNTINGYTFSKDDDIRVGDALVTSGLGEIYTQNLYIGRVSALQRDEGLTINIEVEPVVNFEEIHSVYVLKIDR
ncbi:MAG: rod shape-determining protein MreC [Tissierellales bacterium]|nr:rod shape-determining protein MreC [Tissierellales bacterium]